jgi:low affinity Fe/Cu permease
MPNETKSSKWNLWIQVVLALIAICGPIIVSIIQTRDLAAVVARIDTVIIPKLEDKLDAQSLKVAKLEAYLEMLQKYLGSTYSMISKAVPDVKMNLPEKFKLPRVEQPPAKAE